MHAYLKIKVVSLAAEAKLIRREEKRHPGPSAVRHGLREHRIDVVRRECRHAGLAYGFLRGRRYEQLEAKCHEAPDWKRVQTLAEKYAMPDVDRRDLRQRFAAWIEGH